jgi:hypothetical protein
MLVPNASERWRLKSAVLKLCVEVCFLAFLLRFYGHSLSALAAEDL